MVPGKRLLHLYDRLVKMPAAVLNEISKVEDNAGSSNRTLCLKRQ